MTKARASSSKGHAIDITTEASATSFDMATLAFSEPKNAGSDTCVCVSVPNVAVKVARARVVRLTAQKKSATLLVKVNKVATKFMLAFDEQCLGIATSHASEWFMHKVNPSLIEDFFRPSTEVNAKSDGSIVVRFKLVMSDDDLVPSLSAGSDYDLTLKLVGLQFRKQHFCAVWKMASSSAAAEQPSDRFGFIVQGLDSADDDTDTDARVTDDDLLEQLSLDEVTSMIGTIRASVETMEAHHTEELRRHRTTLSHVKTVRQTFDADLAQYAQASALQNISRKSINDIIKTINALSDKLASIGCMCPKP